MDKNVVLKIPPFLVSAFFVTIIIIIIIIIITTAAAAAAAAARAPPITKSLATHCTMEMPPVTGSKQALGLTYTFKQCILEVRGTEHDPGQAEVYSGRLSGLPSSYIV